MNFLVPVYLPVAITAPSRRWSILETFDYLARASAEHVLRMSNNIHTV